MQREKQRKKTMAAAAIYNWMRDISDAAIAIVQHFCSAARPLCKQITIRRLSRFLYLIYLYASREKDERTKKKQRSALVIIRTTIQISSNFI
jgi:hypothetical protein